MTWPAYNGFNWWSHKKLGHLCVVQPRALNCNMPKLLSDRFTYNCVAPYEYQYLAYSLSDKMI